MIKPLKKTELPNIWAKTVYLIMFDLPVDRLGYKQVDSVLQELDTSVRSKFRYAEILRKDGGFYSHASRLQRYTLKRLHLST